MRKISFVLTVLSLLFFVGCKNNLEVPLDKNYPTTIYKLSDAEYEKAYKEYIAKNPYITSDIDSFGFCSLTKNRSNIIYPPLKTITKEEAEKIIKDFITKNPKETGILDVNKVNLNFSNETFSYDGSQLISFLSENQVVENLELFSHVVFHVYNGQISFCRGNWYEKVYVPRSFSIDSIQAKLKLNNRTMVHYDIAGNPHYVKITSEYLEKSTSKLKIYPKKYANKIELRVVWEVNIPNPIFYKVYMDVMTSEIISEEPTIIS